MDIQRIIDTLERANHEHHSERDGIMSCLGVSYEEVGGGEWKYVEYPERCDCGAAKINAEIDAAIEELRNACPQHPLEPAHVAA